MPLPLQPRRDFFARPDFLDRLAFARDGGVSAVHQNFGGQRAGIVIGRHGKAIGARAHQRQVIAFADFRQRTVLAEIIAGLANAADDIGLSSSRQPVRVSGTISW